MAGKLYELGGLPPGVLGEYLQRGQPEMCHAARTPPPWLLG